MGSGRNWANEWQSRDLRRQQHEAKPISALRQECCDCSRLLPCTVWCVCRVRELQRRDPGYCTSFPLNGQSKDVRTHSLTRQQAGLIWKCAAGGGDPRRRQIVVVRRNKNSKARTQTPATGEARRGRPVRMSDCERGAPSTADQSFVPIWGCSRDGLADQEQGPGLSPRAGVGDGIVLPFCARESRA